MNQYCFCYWLFYVTIVNTLKRWVMGKSRIVRFGRGILTSNLSSMTQRSRFCKNKWCLSFHTSKGDLKTLHSLTIVMENIFNLKHVLRHVFDSKNKRTPQMFLGKKAKQKNNKPRTDVWDQYVWMNIEWIKRNFLRTYKDTLTVQRSLGLE